MIDKFILIVDNTKNLKKARTVTRILIQLYVSIRTKIKKRKLKWNLIIKYCIF